MGLKGLWQEWKAARTQRWYEREARRRGIRSLELKEHLRRRLADRVPKKRPLRIFLAYPLTNWESVLPRSLEPFGRVTTFEWRSLGFDDQAPNWRKDDMNAAMIGAFLKEPADVVVGYFSGATVSPETLRRMAEAGAVVFNFSWDDKAFFANGSLAAAVDLNLTNDPASLVKYAVHGGPAMFWPEAAHPEIHRPHDVPFEFDVSFVGQRYGWRPGFLSRLRRLGIDVACFGPGWPDGALSSEEMVKLYSRSRINLGFAGVRQSRRLMCLKGRDFEIPMSGGLYVTQNNPELAMVYDVGREIVTYAEEEDCARKIRELLAQPERAAAIRKAGRERCLREHTYEAHWAKAFETAGL
jgi:hypothetical protein